MNEHALQAFYNFNPRPVDAWIFEDAQLWKLIEAQILNFPSYVLPSVDKPSALAGIVPMAGVGEVWMITAVGFERQAPVIIQQLRHLCAQYWDVLNLHRLHMRVDSGRQDAKFFAEKVGFKYETTCKNMGSRGQDIDYYVYERISK